MPDAWLLPSCHFGLWGLSRSCKLKNDSTESLMMNATSRRGTSQPAALPWEPTRTPHPCLPAERSERAQPSPLSLLLFKMELSSCSPTCFYSCHWMQMWEAELLPLQGISSSIKSYCILSLAHSLWVKWPPSWPPHIQDGYQYLMNHWKY